MNILFAASECAPFIKTGGLGDVVGALPGALQDQSTKISVILPNYGDLPQKYKDQMTLVRQFTVSVGWRHQYCGLLRYTEGPVRYYFLDNEYYFRRHGCYGYFDDGERFAFFSRAVLEAVPFLLETPDVIHCHDWQTGPICALLKGAHFRSQPMYAHIRTVFTIHNLKYQGNYSKTVLSDLLGLDWSFFTPDGLEYKDDVSYLKAGLAYADSLTTVSSTYAAEIQMPYYGEGMDGFLRKRSHELHGIVNGIDRKQYDPSTDSNLYSRYTTPEGKSANKKSLQDQLRLPVDPGKPLIAMVTRLTEQKGIDLVLRVLHDLLSDDVQFIVLGTGEARYESAFRSLNEQYPAALSAQILFDDALARRIYAGSDLFLMPSKFEPCGIGQLIALRYGSLPVVRETGGLKDTVIPYNDATDQGYGFSFTNYNAHDMLFTIRRALHLYKEHPAKWHDLAVRAMKLDFGWSQSAEIYKKLYSSLF
jgi:glycogen/starch synthases, ADP-glucose type